MKIIILDGYVINPGDLSWEALESIGQLEVYERTSPEDILSRISASYAIFTNKCRITAEIMDKSPNLKFIGVLATGFDNIDIEAARNRCMQRACLLGGKRCPAHFRASPGALQ